MTTPWNDFNSARDPYTFELIPQGTLVKVRLQIQPGGYNDPLQGWEDGYATKNPGSGCVYLKCEYLVLEGPYAKRKLWGLIGLYSPKGPEWAQMGRTFIKGILNSAHGLKPQDNSSAARKARYVNGITDLEGIEFVGQVGIEKNNVGEDRNNIKSISPPHKDYARMMGASLQSNTPAPAQSQPHNSSQPNWLT